MINRFKQFVFSHQKGVKIALILLIVIVGLLITSKSVLAAAPAPGVDTWVLQAVTPLLSLVVELLGKLLSVVIGILISIAQYNGFISSPVVTKGWVLIRDICNMFFVVILIIMAFGTVFQKEQYSYKRLLSSMVFAAVLVNFSKGICGIIIDFSQIIMLTFINAVKAAAAGNFAEMLGLKSMLSVTVLGTNTATSVNFWETIIAYGLAEILLVVALVVFVVITIIILLRIVQLWFLVILSPLAFLATVGIPRLSAYSSKWWDKFGNQVIIGPVLAIFLWLSLAVVAEGFDKVTGPMLIKSGGAEYSVLSATATTGDDKLTATITDIGNTGGLLGFIVGIAMLIASLSMAQEMGVAGAGLATNAANKMKGFAQGAQDLAWKGVGAPLSLAKRGGKAAATSLGEQFQAKTKIPIFPSEIKKRVQLAQQKKRGDRYRKYQEGITPIDEQIRQKGWFAGPANYMASVFGVDKTLRNKGNKELTAAREGAKNYSQTHISESDYKKAVDQKTEMEARKKALETSTTTSPELAKELQGVSANLDGLNQNLAKEKVSNKDWAEKVEKPIEKAMATLRRSREISGPMAGIQSSRESRLKEKESELPGKYNRDAFLAVLQDAKQEKDWDKFQVALREMSGRGDFNEAINEDSNKLGQRYNYDPKLESLWQFSADSPEGYERWARYLIGDKTKHEGETAEQYQQRIKEGFGLGDISEAQEVIDESATIASDVGGRAFTSPYQVDAETGILRGRTLDEYLGDIEYRIRQIDPEKALRGGSKLGLCAEEIDNHGNRIPIFDERSLAEYIYHMSSWEKESNPVGGRIAADLLRYAGSPTAIKFLTTVALPHLVQQGANGNQLQSLVNIITNLQNRFKLTGLKDPGGVIRMKQTTTAPVEANKLKVTVKGDKGQPNAVDLIEVLKKAGIDLTQLGVVK